jgi:hypothetical protein
MRLTFCFEVVRTWERSDWVQGRLRSVKVSCMRERRCCIRVMPSLHLTYTICSFIASKMDL